MFTYHHRKDNGSPGGLDNPQKNETAELNYGKEVHLPQRYMSQVDEVWLMLSWHTKQREAIKELQEIGKRSNLRVCCCHGPC